MAGAKFSLSGDSLFDDFLLLVFNLLFQSINPLTHLDLVGLRQGRFERVVSALLVERSLESFTLGTLLHDLPFELHD